jgi:hypothetical protein
MFKFLIKSGIEEAVYEIYSTVSQEKNVKIS